MSTAAAPSLRTAPNPWTALTRRLDRTTGRVTMYRLVLLALLVLAAVSLLLSLLGQLAYPLTGLLATGAVAVVVTCATSWLFARLFRTRAHPESALITGLLLFFLFVPSTAVSDLLSVGIAAVVASASKYLLAFRGRHVFNPAAIGVVVVSLLQQYAAADWAGSNVAIWWAGTAYLLPVVAVGGFLVLYRSRKLPVAVTFLVLAALLAAARAAASGTGFADALVVALVSSPIVFLAVFMLSEPLTLPPRRWQQFAIAALVAVLYAVPLGYYVSPELALVVGNLVAFVFGQRRGIRLDLVGKRRLTPTAWELAFQPASPVRFQPGQYLELTVPHRADFRGSRRTFSISSAPVDDGPLTVALTVPEKPSSFKRAMLELEPGSRVRATGVGGDFMLPRDPATPVLLVAGGIGITPFASQLGHEKPGSRDIVVVYAVREGAELGYADLLERSGARVVVVSPTQPDDLPATWTWHAGRVTGELLAEAVPDLGRRRAYVSGSPSLVADVKAALRRLGVRRITADYFSGY
jgi:ferredoxin-NADP reductase